MLYIVDALIQLITLIFSVLFFIFFYLDKMLTLVVSVLIFYCFCLISVQPYIMQ